MAGHRKQWCPLCCCWMFVCSSCGNNTCNGGYGIVNGETCEECPNAYEAFFALANEPPPPEEPSPIEEEP